MPALLYSYKANFMQLRFCLLIICALTASMLLAQQKPLTLFSPDQRTELRVTVDSAIRFQVFFNKKEIISPSAVALLLKNQPIQKPVIQKRSTRTVNDVILPPVPEKRKTIPDNFAELTIRFRQPLSLQFRAYNDGIAYRWISEGAGELTVINEIAEVCFPENHPVYFSEVVKRNDQDIFHTSFEEPYQLKPIDSIGPSQLIFSPLLTMPVSGPKILLTESDLEDYPGMFFTGTHTQKLVGRFAPYPDTETITTGEFPQSTVSTRKEVIAITHAKRSFPWRIMAIAASDKDLPGNDIVYRLGAPSRVSDPSWIKPGKGTDEWIIGVNIFNVPFKSGVNTATYKYYIDFAKRFGFDRIMMDAGWSDYKDLFKVNPQINMEEISAYAKSKGIGLSMWTLAMTLDQQLEPALEQFNKWGVDFIMTDFMDRDDQKMVNFYHRIAEACAKHKIMVMFHGAFKPAGFSRTWPNAVTREGVLGSEYNIWSEKATPEHNLLLPFIRMVGGPMDYEPGILDNATKETFRPIGNKVMAPGTRCHQMAMFVVYESPIQIFSGNPSQGLMEPAFMELLGSIPTVWDTTLVLDGRVGDYIITARKKGDDWFIGAMSDWTGRSITVSLDFLNPAEYELVSCSDGINADRYASDYKIENSVIKKGHTLTISMAPGGGYVARLKRR